MPTGQVLWFTGLSGSGKTTLCQSVGASLRETDLPVQLLDSDMVRRDLWNDLGYSEQDRIEHNRRLGYLAGLLSQHGITVLVAAISPLRSIREQARRTCPRFCEVFVDAPLSVCEQRDPKGLYRRFRSGMISNFTGIDAPYERPVSPEIVCQTALESIMESTEKVLHFLKLQRGL